MRGDGWTRLKGRFWHFFYYGPTATGWKQIEESSRSTEKRVAETLLAKRVREVRNHRDGLSLFIAPQERRITVRRLCDDLLDKMKGERKKSVRTAAVQLKHFIERFGGHRAASIKNSTLRDYQKHRLREGAAAATIDRELELVHRAFQIGFEEGKVSSVPTFSRLQRMHGNARRGFLQPSEFNRLVNEIEDEAFRDFLLWFWWTGMRNGEIASLRWNGIEDGDPRQIVLYAEDAKTGEARNLPLVVPLLEVIERREAKRVSACPFVFHSSGSTFRASNGGLPNWCYRAWREACEASGLRDLRPYDLRRSAVRNLINSGVPETTAMKISGHKSRETFRRYLIVDPSEIAAAIEKVSSFITPRMRTTPNLRLFSRDAGKTRAKRSN